MKHFVYKYLTTILTLSFSFVLSQAQVKSDLDVLSLPEPKLVPIYPTDSQIIKKTDSIAKVALTFCETTGFDTRHCILFDISVHSGRNRLFVYDFDSTTIIRKCLVSNGCGDGPWGWDSNREEAPLSNEHQSHCSSVGKYKIGKRGYSNWGINVNYRLHGIESTNNNAYDRIVVLHGWKDIGDDEVYPDGTPEGWGCPAVSNQSMRYLDSILKSKTKPVLFWIYLGFE